jgi:hypothetical protein
MHLVAIDSLQLTDSSFRKRFDLRGITSQSSKVISETVAYLWVEAIGVFNGLYSSLMSFYSTWNFG